MELIGGFHDDYMNLKGFGCVNVNHISIISGRKWGTDNKVPVYNIMIKGTKFTYISEERYEEKELTKKITEIIKAIRERSDGAWMEDTEQ